MAQDYSKMLADEKAKGNGNYERMKAQLDNAKLSYTEPTQPEYQPKPTKDYSALEVGAIARGENPNMSSAQFESQKRADQSAWESQSPENANSQEALVNKKINSGEWQFLPDGRGGGQYVDSKGNGTLNVSGGNVNQGTTNQYSNLQYSNLQQAIQQPAIQQPAPKKDYAYTAATDNSGLITKSYDEQKSSALTALKAAIEKAKGGYNTLSTEAKTSFDPLKNQTTVAKNEQLGRLRESMANQGQLGGVSRSEELQVQTSAEEKLNSINQQQQQVIDDANKSIAELEANGQLQEAQVVSENANNKIKALMEEANRVDTTNYSRKQDALTNQRYDEQTALEAQRYANTQQQQKTATELEAQRYASETANRDKTALEAKAEKDLERKRADFAATINPKEDLTAKINQLERDGVDAEDFRYTELKKARNQKIANMDQANYEQALAQLKSEDDRQETALEFAWKKFNAGLPADKVTAQLLGIKPGDVIPSQKMKEASAMLDKQKVAISQQNSNKKSGGSSKPKTEKKAEIKQPSSTTAKSAYDYLTKLENARDLVGINAFMNNNMQELDLLARTGSEADLEYLKELRKRFNKYK
jgi:hypothetical protein